MGAIKGCQFPSTWWYETGCGKVQYHYITDDISVQIKDNSENDSDTSSCSSSEGEKQVAEETKLLLGKRLSLLSYNLHI